MAFVLRFVCESDSSFLPRRESSTWYSLGSIAVVLDTPGGEFQLSHVQDTDLGQLA